MPITTDPIPGLTIDELNHLTSSIGTDTVTWGTIAGTSDPYYGAIPGGSNGYTYTTTGTTSVSPWLSVGNGGTGSSPAMTVQQSGTIDLRGENPDIKINGKSMKTWMEAVEERLNILTPNPELEKDWDELQELGERYRALEKKCKEKAQMWEALKKVQPKQP